MLSTLMLAVAKHPFNPRGKQKLLSLYDTVFGPSLFEGPKGVRLETFLSSSQDLSFLRESPDALAEVINGLPDDGVFVDVGANVGYYTILANKITGTRGISIAIEPSRREYIRLLRNCAKNTSERVLPLNIAAGETAGCGTLKVAKYHTGLNHLLPSCGSPEAGKAEFLQPCTVMPLDEILPPLLQGRSVSLLKIDIEGAELLALRGARKLLSDGAVDGVYVEVTDEFLSKYGHSADDLYAFMASVSYKPTQGPRDGFQYDEYFVPKNPARHSLRRVTSSLAG